MNEQEFLQLVGLSALAGAVVACIGIGIARVIGRAYYAGLVGLLFGGILGFGIMALARTNRGHPIVAVLSGGGAWHMPNWAEVVLLCAMLSGIAAMLVADTRSFVIVLVSALVFSAVAGGLAGAMGGSLAALLMSRLFKVRRDDNSSEICQLRETLTSKDEYQRWQAISRLGELGDVAEDAVPDLVRFIDGSVVSHRVAAINSIARIRAGAQVAVPNLKMALNSDDEQVKEAASKALQAIASYS